MNYNDMTMIELREMCAKHGIVAGRSKAETIKRIEARDAELQDFANRHGEALAKDGMAIRSGGKDYKPEDHQPCQGCETIKAEAALAEYRAAHPEIAAEGAKMCDCDPVGDAARASTTRASASSPANASPTTLWAPWPTRRSSR